MQRRTFVMAAAAAALTASMGAHAQDWPTQPVKLVVGFPGGSTPDMVARTLSEPLSKLLGQPVIIENKPGASGNIAADHVAKATDGHTLGIVINGNLTSSQMLYPSLPYDPVKDFSYISLLTTAPLILVAPASEPGGTAFFDKARQEGDRWNYGSVGVGSVSHLGMELLKGEVPGLKPMLVPYTGGNPAVVTALIGGQVQMALMPPGVAMPQVEAGKLKAIGVTTAGPSPLVPSVPSLSEAGVKDFTLEVWTALVGPASLPEAVQQKISASIMDILKTPATQEKLLTQGWKAVGTTPEGMKTRVEKETELLGGIIRSQNIRLQ
ncbi:tripartite tricarboxylate transporter substrate binding protein [Castellaniella sp. GW247-6E4]|uniref:Bug family tripartite tricarboxylate transporter substrate binding protein n=1 Tax=Castellaniella sp. GW247-6E4 TaxID=3140380 RepID=UPI003315799F